MDEASADLFGHLAALVGADLLAHLRDPPRRRRRLRRPRGVPRPASSSVRSGSKRRPSSLTWRPPTTPLPQPGSMLLVDRSAGNPLFLRELLAVASPGGRAQELPDSVEQVVAARIDRLSPDDRHLLRRISVLGQSFPHELLADVVEDVPGRVRSGMGAARASSWSTTASAG